MIQICCVCKEIYGEKEPYEDKEYTHGYCSECFKLEMAKLKEQMLEMGIQPEENPIKRIWNPDYLALGKREFRKLKKQDPGYYYSRYITFDEFYELTGEVFNPDEHSHYIID